MRPTEKDAPAPFLNTKIDERHAALSPDGRWLTYQSNASGQQEVYIRPFPAKEPLHPVSRGGGQYSAWSGDGKELFFLSPDGALMSSRSDTASGFAANVPQRLFATPIRPGNNRPYAVADNGKRFLIPIPANPPLRVILDWRAARRQ